MKTVHIPIKETQWIKFKIRCLEMKVDVQDRIRDMILEQIKEKGPASKSV